MTLFVADAAAFSLAELCAARLDGELYALGDGYVPIDEPERSELRARSVLAERSSRIIAELGTAAWIWGASPIMPQVHELCADHARRSRPNDHTALAVREVRFGPGDITKLDGFRLTTPLRTAVDLARFRQPFRDADRKAVFALAELAGFSFEDCVELMDRGANLHGKRRARERLETTLARQPLLTRYTS